MEAAMPGLFGLVFPNGAGRPENRGNIVNRGWVPLQIAAGICTVEKDATGKVVVDSKGEPVRKAKYPGLHAARHFYASWCINRKADGGLELPGKVVQERMGHSDITMTMNTYGHLFPRGDDKAELAAAEPGPGPHRRNHPQGIPLTAVQRRLRPLYPLSNRNNETSPRPQR
jgi:integrase